MSGDGWEVRGRGWKGRHVNTVSVELGGGRVAEAERRKRGGRGAHR